ncbi:MAG: pleD [Verrucomicrobiales bacterium]|nr:pleD [Verrucomicrobiales bacterium]
MLIRNRGNRQALESGLEKEYQLVSPDTEPAHESESITEHLHRLLEQNFDLAIIDGPMLKQLKSKVRKCREARAPVFLPFLLLTVRRKGNIPTRALGKLVDDVIVKPVHRTELFARVENLLRRRELSMVYKKEHDTVTRLVVTDDVTGYHNTRYLRRYMDKFFGAQKLRGKRLSLVFFDIDDFKTVVDTYGHQMGSKVLREIAQAVNKVLDAEDRIVRYGGDEFVVVLPGQDRAAAAMKVEAMREAISETEFLDKEEFFVRVTASFGMATFPHDAKDEESLLAAADECLFESKRQGKNRITLPRSRRQMYAFSLRQGPPTVREKPDRQE